MGAARSLFETVCHQNNPSNDVKYITHMHSVLVKNIWKCKKNIAAGTNLTLGFIYLMPRKTWLESVEVDMAELEIDKEDVHDRRIVNVMKRKSNPIGKRTINR